MQTLPGVIVLLASLTTGALAATTINPTNHFAYGANIGWLDWHGDVTNGVVIGEFVCSGYIYAANVGWIHLGDGAPANGIRYQNNSATDYGVNHDVAGNLRGFAYGGNIGWINFTNRAAGGATYDGPQVDLLTGKLSGFAWSANCGWISLSNASAFVQTYTIPMGFDSDGDGIPDAWELGYANNLAAFSSAGDFDRDGFSDVNEYLADTDPFDPGSNLRITLYAFGSGGSPVTLTWTSRPTRLYHAQKRTELIPGFLWVDVGLGSIAPDSGGTTTRTFSDAASYQRFFRIEAFRPLSP